MSKRRKLHKNKTVCKYNHVFWPTHCALSWYTYTHGSSDEDDDILLILICRTTLQYKQHSMKCTKATCTLYKALLCHDGMNNLDLLVYRQRLQNQIAFHAQCFLKLVHGIPRVGLHVYRLSCCAAVPIKTSANAYKKTLKRRGVHV